MRREFSAIMECVTSTSLTQSAGAPVVNRPNVVAIGTIVWLGSEVMFFSGLFAIYFTLRSTSPELWAAETAILNVPFALTITTILVLSSVTAQFGVFAAERLQPRRTGGVFQIAKWGMVEWFFLSFILGAMFVTGQVFEYATLVSEHVSISSNQYGSAFYLTTGFHGLHVLGGLIAFLLIIGRAYSVKRFGHKEATSAIVVSYYWHFVDVVWIGLFLVIYVLK
jgi:cytochrome c oxidase subunit 3